MSFLLVGCTPTTVNISSNPATANVSMSNSGMNSTTNTTLKMDEKFFGDKESRDEEFCFYKVGYRNKCKVTEINKSKENNINISLDKIDSSITFNTQPQGATIILNSNNLPSNWQKSFKTPATFEATSKEIKKLNAESFGIETVRYDGYIVQNINQYRNDILEASKAKSINIKLTPIITTVRVMTEPVGATVEDITQGGFGYLGESPIIRNLTFKDISNWAERKNVRRTNGGFESIELNLRITKPGYKDVIMQSLRIPVGEERTFKRGLKQLAKEVNFSSDPESVHVYASRVVIQELYDEQQGVIVTKKVPFMKHLGTTPFTYNIDLSKPLKHGDALIFKKSGYNDGTIQYAQGQDGFHIVLEPKVIKAR